MSTDNQTIYHCHTGPVPLAVEKKMIADDYAEEIFNDYGFVVRAQAESGEDIHLWTFIYQQQGDEIILDGDVTQTLLVYGKFSDAEKQYMNPGCATVNKGQNIENYFPPGSIKWTETDKDVKWEVGGRVHWGAPPEWKAGGEHAGVKLNLHFTQYNPAFYHCGRFEDATAPVGNAGYIVHTRVSGTIEVHGKTLTIKNGFGIHERIKQHGIIADRTAFMSGRGLHWMHGFSEGFTWYLMRGDVGRGMSSAMINIGDKQIVLEDPTSSGVEETAHWIDPESRIVSPYKWKIWVKTAQGTLVSMISAYGRQYYTWIRRNGTLVVNQYVADAETIFTYPDGRVVEAHQMISIEHMRTLYRQATQ